MTFSAIATDEIRNDEEETWDEEEAEWHRLEKNRRTCVMRRTCAAAALAVYLFLIANWKLGKAPMDGF